MESRGPRVFRLLGLARRAGGVAPGTDAVRRAIREGEAQLILMAGDASSVQLDKIRSTLHDRPIPQVILGDRNTLGAAVGLAPLSAVAVTNRSLATQLIAELRPSDDEGGIDAVEA
ncbi:MAG: ribosomal L7Ae/L30e/S12e/Gadd45 family protein [Gemmatimonadetes bacterium]|nr:ribosomal L7Ae/L30e/S12e/Gadd45 family protein [Gemmatimonadota bacterium]